MQYTKLAASQLNMQYRIISFYYHHRSVKMTVIQLMNKLVAVATTAAAELI